MATLLRFAYTNGIRVRHRKSFNIMPGVTDCLMERMGSALILSVKQSVTIGSTLNFVSDRRGNGTCKRTFYSMTSIHAIGNPNTNPNPCQLLPADGIEHIF